MNFTETDIRRASDFVERVGIALVFPAEQLSLPSLWEEVVGRPEVTVFTMTESGRRVLSPELEWVWSLKDRLAEERLACVGKHIAGRLAVISPELVSSVYALTGRAGRPDDFRDPSLLPRLELDLASILLKVGPLTGPDLRRVLGRADAKRTKLALERLQRRFVVTQAGELPQERGWAAAIFDLVARRYRARLRRLPWPAQAQMTLARTVLGSAGELSAAGIASILGISQSEGTVALNRLADQDVARRYPDGRKTLWRPARPAIRS